MNIRRISVLLAIAAGSVVSAQQPAESGAVIRTETRVVLVDAVVTDKKGGYVHGLTAKDFTVLEDKKEQTITSFSFAADPASPLSSTPRYIVLYFDNSAMTAGTQSFARRAASQLIDANAGPNRMMAIVNFGGSLQITQNFTSDPERLKAVVNAMKTSATTTAGRGPEAAYGRRDSILALRALAKNLSRVRGRKTLILLTDGFPLNRELRDEASATIDTLNRSNVAVYPVDVRGLAGGDGAGPIADASSSRPSNGGGNRNPRQPQVLRTPVTNQELMTMLASGSGGFSILNSNDLAGGMEKIASELNEYYLIGYTPPDSKEGTCHNLHVKLDRGGVNVRFRNSYCNAQTEETVTQNPALKKLETMAGADHPGNMPAAMQIPFFYTSPNVARVNVALEISTKSLKFEKEKDHVHAAIEVLGVAMKPDGSVGARFSDTVNLNFQNAEEADRFKQSPYHYANQFDIASGTYQLKVAFSSGGDNFGKVERPLEVQPYDGARFSISPVAFSTSFTRVAQGESPIDTALLEDRTPLMALGLRLEPSGTNQFTAAQTPVAYFEVYEPEILKAPTAAKPLAVALQIRLVDIAKGTQLVDSGGFRIPLPERPTSVMIPWAAKIPVEQLKPGTYRMVIDAIDTAGGKTTRTAEFTIE